MGAWSLYFLAKVGLYYGRAIGFHWLWNALFAVALAWPLAQPRARLLRTALAIPAAVVLLYFDSHLPPVSRLIDQAGALSNFRGDYLLELLQRFVPMRSVLLLGLLVLAYSLLQHRLRFATLAFAALGVAAIVPPPSALAPAVEENLFARVGETAPAAVPEAEPGELAPAQLDAALADFYGGEHGKTVSFARAGIPRFDLVLLSICSLSNDDLAFEHMQDAPLLRRFDLVFRNFNSAATYSGPAVLRLLHGTCGQTPQRELYSGTAADDCYLFRNLAAAGYQPALLFNHDGHFDNFGEQLRMQGGMGIAPLDNRAAPVSMTSFDGTPIRSDYAVLAQWWNQPPPADGHRALLYNTITLHDGNRVPGMAGSTSIETYAPRLRRLFADLDRFLDLVESSGRPTVVVLIPEHGAALRGDAIQVSGLRELPMPAITNVPAAVKLVNFPGSPRGAPPEVVDAPSSYLALTALVAGLVQIGPDGATRDALHTLASALPRTEWIAENEGTVLLRQGRRSYLRAPEGSWVPVGG